MKKIGLFLGVFFSLVLLNLGPLFAEEPAAVSSEPQAAAPEPELQWVWGEAVNLDPQNKLIMVKYLDYETDQEKEISIGVDDKTTFENIKDILEIKPQDMLSIDYVVTGEGKNIAKNISLEKPEVKSEPQAAIEPVTKPAEPEVVAPQTEGTAESVEPGQAPQVQAETQAQTVTPPPDTQTNPLPQAAEVTNSTGSSGQAQ